MTAVHQTSRHGAPSGGALLLMLMKLRTFIALLAVLILFAALAPNFMSTANLILMAKHVALNAFLAIGMSFVIIAGGLVLPIGYIVWLSVPETVALGVLIGAVNGLLIARLNVAPFIATLGTLYVAPGVALLVSDGRTFPNLAGTAEHANQGFDAIGNDWLLNVPFNPAIRGEDVATIMLGHAGGVTSMVDCSSATVLAEDPFPETVVEVDGTEGTVRLGAGYRLAVATRAGSRQVDVSPPLLAWASRPWHNIQESVASIQRRWVDCLRSGQEPDTSGRDNLEPWRWSRQATSVPRPAPW